VTTFVYQFSLLILENQRVSSLIPVEVSQYVIHIEPSFFGIDHVLQPLLFLRVRISLSNIRLFRHRLIRVAALLLILLDDLVFLEFLGHLLDLLSHVFGLQAGEAATFGDLFLWVGTVTCGLTFQALVHDHFLVVQDVILVHVTRVLLHHIHLWLALSDRVCLGRGFVFGSAGGLFGC